ncbi:WD40-repeat-containing domain protein [Cladorrhinum sp. PSN259]|nr:WD40-repeat-containing domain protein [Cladorrhinum sp. PSN259]
MRPRGRHALGSSSLDQPRRLGSLINTTYASAIHTASLLHTSSAFASTSGRHGYPQLAMSYTQEKADDEYQDTIDELESTTSSGEEEEYEEDEEDYEDDYYEDEDEDDEEGDDDDDDQSSHSSPHLCPHNHLYIHQHHHPHPLQRQHHSYLHHLEHYDSDDLDMSEDAGTPLVNYLDIANILTVDNMDTDSSVSEESEDELEYSSDVDTEHDGYSESASDVGSDGEEESESDGNGDSHGGNSSTESQLADDASVVTVLQPYAAGFGFLTAGTGSVSANIDEHWSENWWGADNSLNPHTQALIPSNYGLVGFLNQWARQGRMLQGLSRGRSPWPDKVDDISASDVTRVKHEELQGNKYDIQGVNWDDLGVSRREARERRLLTYANYTNCANSDRWTPDFPDVILPRSDNFFRFRRMDVKRNTHLAHFQLRYLLACTSRTRFFYPSLQSVVQFNPISRQSRVVIKTGDEPNAQVSAIASDHGVLASGCFNGDYTLRPLNTVETESNPCHTGSITSDPYGITNHIQIHLGRLSSSPVAAFSSNDKAVRVLDIATEKWLSTDEFDFPVNCTAISPDQRLRAVVGDNKNLIIAAAESTLGGSKPEIFYDLKGHRDFGFAVDWADDGWTIASAFQDKTVKIWDARYLTDSSGESKPVTTIRTEIAGARNLKFSPIGSGKRVLVAAEEADYVNVIDAQTFRSKQTIDFFGEIGGVSFANEGQDLIVLCCDPHRGGLLQFERCGLGASEYRNLSNLESLDWPRSIFTEEKWIRHGRSRRRGSSYDELGPDDLEPF